MSWIIFYIENLCIFSFMKYVFFTFADSFVI